MGVISWIILGLIAGFIASKILNRTGSGLVLDLVLGMVGAAVGGLIFSGLFGERGHRPQPVEHHCLGDWRDNRAVDLRGSGREILTRSGSRSVRQPTRRSSQGRFTFALRVRASPRLHQTTSE